MPNPLQLPARRMSPFECMCPACADSILWMNGDGIFHSIEFTPRDDIKIDEMTLNMGLQDCSFTVTGKATPEGIRIIEEYLRECDRIERIQEQAKKN